MLREPLVTAEKPTEEDHGLPADPGKEAALRGRRMGFSDPVRPEWLPPDRDHAEVRDVGQWDGDNVSGIARHLDIFGRR